MRWQAVPLAFLVLFLVVPLAFLARAAAAGPWAWLASPYVAATLQSACAQAATTTLLAVLLGGGIAILHHRSGASAALQLHAAPFVMPVFVVVYGLQATLGPALRGVGPAVGGWLGADPALAAPFGAVVLANTYYNYGFAARLLADGLESRPVHLEEAAATLGASPWVRFWRITAPHLAPTVGTTALLVFLFAFNAFGTVLLLGDGVVRTLETVMYGQLGVFGSLSKAALLGAVQVAVNGTLLGGYLLLRRRVHVHTPKTRPRRRLAMLAWPLAAVPLVPLAAVLVGGFRIHGRWSLAAVRDLAAGPDGFAFLPVLLRTLGYAGASALLALGLTLLLAPRGPAGSRLEALAGLPATVSSVLLGVALAAAFRATPLADSGLLLILAYTLLAFPLTARLVLPTLGRHRALEESAQLLGARPWAVAWRIRIPLARRPILAAGAVTAALAIGDLGAASILSVHATRPLAVWTWALDGPFDPVRHARAVLLAGVSLVLALAAFLAMRDHD